MICEIDGCERRASSRKMCQPHYRRWKRHGDPLAGRKSPTGRTVIPPEERFWPKVDKSGDCWLWTAGKFPDGYGSFRFDGVMTGSHRVSYELTYGAIPAGMEIDHRCRNRLCVRPDHLRAVTKKQNLENHSGPQRNNTSGARGVSWYPLTNRWVVHVAHRTVGYFLDLEEAKAAAVAARNEMFTHNDIDREAC